MVYALDLSPRQTARTLEQAIRHRALVFIEPRTWTGGEVVAGRLEPSEGRSGPGGVLIILPGEPPLASEIEHGRLPAPLTPELIERTRLLVGTYADVSIQLGENRYLFSSDVVRVETVPGVLGARMEMSRPKTVQVAQRRRSWRFRPARSSQIDLRWGQGQAPGYAAAWLCNISADGMACRCHGRVGEQLWIGDELTAEFTLTPEDPRRYVMDAVLCSKTPAGSPDKLILGLEFLTGSGHDATRKVAEMLREQLLTTFHSSTNASKGAD